ncbi:uncharacterized protein [Primulina eburnea]|uniref:uncharacterized protein n=1 Tax=Primulina eburnea TaxID=1245227 RepID=UPI003C6C3E90
MASILLLLSELLRRENLDILIMSSSFDHSTATKSSVDGTGSLPQSCKNNALQDNQIQEDLPKLSAGDGSSEPSVLYFWKWWILHKFSGIQRCTSNTSWRIKFHTT